MTKDNIVMEWKKVLEKSDNYSKIEPIAQFVQLLIHCDKEDMLYTLEFLRTIEHELLDRNLISFKVESYEDIDRINPTYPPGKIQWYIWSLMSRMI